MKCVINQMASHLSHRGPDSNGFWIDETVGLALGHRRLAILDLTLAGHQPMLSDNGRYVITYNGEIYNHQSLRQELSKLGHSFSGVSDTSVMLAAFSEWGIIKSIEKFVGMFAFCLWDSHEQTLYLARDRMGEKPLYYGWSNQTFLFASELKAFYAHPNWKPEIDRNVLTMYFRYNYVPAPYSIYKQIYKLSPGSVLKFPLSNMEQGYCPTPDEYWSLKRVALWGTKNPYDYSESKAIEELENLLREVIRGQMIADVPIGAFLSGGIDSSLVASLMQVQSKDPIMTFTIGMHDAKFNEAQHAKEIAQHLGTNHTEFYVSPQDAINVIPLLPHLYDEPFADSSQIPTYLVAKMARQNVTVSLVGDGGDEVFCGYNRHIILENMWRKIQHIPYPLRKRMASLLEVLPSSLFEAILRKQNNTGVLADQIQKLSYILKLSGPEEMYRQLTNYWDAPELLVINAVEPESLLTKQNLWPQLNHTLEKLLYLESVTSLPDDMLVKVDRATMGVGLETRVPFLDHRVVEFSWRLPLSMKLRDGKGKWILRQILYKYIPPKLIERPKWGFGIPIDLWLKGPLRGWAEDMLSEKRLSEEGFLNVELVRRKWYEHLRGHKKWQWHLWSVLMFEAWLENLQDSRLIQ